MDVDPYGHTCPLCNHLVANIDFQLDHSSFFSRQLQEVRSLLAFEVELVGVDPLKVYVEDFSNQEVIRERVPFDGLL